MLILFNPGTTSFNEEQVHFKQKYEEQHITAILELLTSYIKREDDENLDTVSYEFPPTFVDILKKSCLIPVLCSYLRNDSGTYNLIFVNLFL